MSTEPGQLHFCIFAGCGSGLAGYLNDQFPPVDVEVQRKKALEAASAALEALETPNLAFGVSLGQTEHLLTDLLRDHGVTKVRLRSREQLLEIRITFRRTLTSDGDAGDLHQMLQNLQPVVAGRLTFLAGVAGDMTAAVDELHLKLKILPAFHSLRLSEVSIKERIDISALGGALADAIGRYADNVSGYLASLSIMDVEIPTRFVDTIDPNRTLHLADDALRGEVKVTANSIASPVRLAGIAPLVSQGRLVVLAQLSSVAALAEPVVVPVSSPVDGVSVQLLERNFGEMVQRSVGLANYPEGIWAAVRKDLVATAANSFFQEAQACFSLNAHIAKEKFSKKIGFPDASRIDCTPTRDCTPKRRCDFKKSHDRRSCRRKGPFGVRYNDPFCEAAKAAQNLAYEADYAGKKMDCERLKSQEKLQCEVEKSGKKLLCEAGKEAFKALARSGNFATVSGSYEGSGAATICVRDFTLSPALDRVQVALGVEGQAGVDLSLKFVPLDIVGHLACQMPWTEKQSFDARISPTTLPIETRIELQPTGRSIAYRFTTEEVQVRSRLEPGIAEFLLTSANMNLACRGSDLFRPLLVPASSLVPELRGQFVHRVGPISLGGELQTPIVEVLQQKVTLEAGQTEPALILSGVLSAGVSDGR